MTQLCARAHSLELSTTLCQCHGLRLGFTSERCQADTDCVEQWKTDGLDSSDFRREQRTHSCQTEILHLEKDVQRTEVLC